MASGSEQGGLDAKADSKDATFGTAPAADSASQGSGPVSETEVLPHAEPAAQPAPTPGMSLRDRARLAKRRRVD